MSTKQKRTKALPARGNRKPGRPKSSNTESQQGRRDLILSEAATLFAELGYSAATMDELAERTGLNKGTLYYYYKSKADILFELALSANQQTSSIADASLKLEKPGAQMSAFIEAMVSWVLSHREIAIIFIREQELFKTIFDERQLADVTRIHRAYMRSIYGILSEGVQLGEFRPCDVVTIGRTVSTALFSLATLRSPSSPEAVPLAQQTKLLFLNGLFREKA